MNISAIFRKLGSVGALVLSLSGCSEEQKRPEGVSVPPQGPRFSVDERGDGVRFSAPTRDEGGVQFSVSPKNEPQFTPNK